MPLPHHVRGISLFCLECLSNGAMLGAKGIRMTALDNAMLKTQVNGILARQERGMSGGTDALGVETGELDAGGREVVEGRGLNDIFILGVGVAGVVVALVVRDDEEDVWWWWWWWCLLGWLRLCSGSTKEG